jgi:hypothetical protein
VYSSGTDSLPGLYRLYEIIEIRQPLFHGNLKNYFAIRLARNPELLFNRNRNTLQNKLKCSPPGISKTSFPAVKPV